MLKILEFNFGILEKLHSLIKNQQTDIKRISTLMNDTEIA